MHQVEFYCIHNMWLCIIMYDNTGEVKSVIGGGELTKSSSASGSETMKLVNQGSFGKNRRRSSVSDEARKLKLMNDLLKSQKGHSLTLIVVISFYTHRYIYPLQYVKTCF